MIGEIPSRAEPLDTETLAEDGPQEGTQDHAQHRHDTKIELGALEAPARIPQGLAHGIDEGEGLGALARHIRTAGVPAFQHRRLVGHAHVRDRRPATGGGGIDEFTGAHHHLALEFGLVAQHQVGGDIPGADHRQAHHQAAEDIVETAPEVRGLEHETQHQQGQQQADDQTRGVGGFRACEEGTQVLGTGQVDGQGTDPVNEQQRHQGLVTADGVDHVVGDRTDDEKHHDGLEVATPDTDQGLVATAGAKGHADAEQQSAQQVLGPDQLAHSIGREGIVGVRQVHGLQYRHPKQGHGDGQQPGAHAAGIAHVHPVGDGTHGAEVGLVGDRAQHQGQQEGAPQ